MTEADNRNLNYEQVFADDSTWSGSPEDCPLLLAATCQDPEQEVLVVGTRHFNNAADPQAIAIESLWQRYIEGCANRPAYKTITMIEGGTDRVIDGETPLQALHRDGEQAMVATLATQHEAILVNAEEDYKGQIPRMTERYGPADTAYYYYMRMGRQYLVARETGQVSCSFYEYVMNRQTVQNIVGHPDLNFELRALQATHRLHYPNVPFDPLEPLANGTLRTADDLEAMCFLMGDEGRQSLTLLQEMSVYICSLRGKHFLRIIQEHWDSGSSVFFAPGISHVKMLERTLESVLVNKVQRAIGISACLRYANA